MSFIQYILQEYPTVLSLLAEHVQLTFLAVAIAIIIGIPLGILVYSTQRVDKAIMGSVNLIQAIPSMAMLGAVIPLLGIGKLPAIVVVALYSLLPIVKNTFTGIRNTPREILEAAKGIGLTDAQTLFKVQIPIALPVIMAGVRISAVTAVGLITIAAFIGAGGLGFLVFSGISTVNNNLILAGAIPACILALLVDYLGAVVEKKISAKASGKKRPLAPLAFPPPGTRLPRLSLCVRADCSGTASPLPEKTPSPSAAKISRSNTFFPISTRNSSSGTRTCMWSAKPTWAAPRSA